MPFVVVQEDEATDALKEWWVAEPHIPDANASEECAWTEVCTKLVKEAVGENERTPWNVFLAFGPEEFPGRRHGSRLSRLIRRARNRTWGSRLILVLSNAPLIKDMDASAKADMTRWMKRLLAGKVSDLIEISERLDGNDPDPLRNSLRDRAGSVVERQNVFRAVSGQRRWRGALPANWGRLAAFLDTSLAITEPDGDLSVDLLIVLMYSENPVDQEAEIERQLAKDIDQRQRLCRIVTYKHEPRVELQQYCASHRLGTPVAIGGDFELWYLLLRLNAHAEMERFEHLQAIQPVRLSETAQISTPSPDTLPAVLVTSVFGMGESKQWLEAATDVGELLYRSPLGMEYRIELGVDPSRLLETLDDMRKKTRERGEKPVLNAWIHMGHGLGKAGLWVADGYAASERWIKCFKDWELHLALFLTCDSHVIARDFAAHGTGVAIGIDGIVESNRTRQLAIGVLNAVLAEGTKGGTILAGFKAGRARLESVQLLEAKAWAYYPRRV